MDLLEAIKTRHTVREFDNKKVPIELLKELIEAARWAPSGHNLQPWMFVIVTKEDIIKKVADIVNKKGANLFTGFNTVMKDVSRKLGTAPALILVYGTGSLKKVFEDLGGQYRKIGELFEAQSISAAIQNLLLCATNKNLGVGWFGMTVFCEKEINFLLNIEGDLHTILAVGYGPNEKKIAVRKRKEINEIVKYVL